MSRQLAISAAFSTLAMAAFALLAGSVPGTLAAARNAGNAGIPNGFEAPAFATAPDGPRLRFPGD